MIKLYYPKVLLFAACLLLPSSSTEAEIVVGMVGEVEEGNFNGADLAGSQFVFGGIITNPTDIDDVFPDIGTFAVNEAFLDVGDRGLFVFDPLDNYFYWGFDRGDFHVGTVRQVDVSTSTYRHGLQLWETDSSLDFDPSVLRSFGPYDAFDSSLAYGVWRVAWRRRMGTIRS